ncbi:type I polyketide synthase [Nocardia spumae]|uniref:type I polyketide synthase n=1 Tax=Nocardia spumae TaxID=2887190 RepID=UPI001D15B255|nr:type I polyketide synthase [Nocardia spumae]
MSDIAIVGIGCRYAGGIESPESFWEFVLNKRDGVVDIPADRWDHRRYYDPDRRAPGRAYTKRAAFMTGDPWEFDPDFFGISPREAATLDPQQRLALEVSWEALDDAGVGGRVGGAPVGVYMGVFTMDHGINPEGAAALAHVDMHSAAGASYTMISNRIAYALNMVGPAITVDTACSSSLVAFHLACRAIVDGDCEMALAGGVTVMTAPESFVSMCKGGFLSADGRSKPFDAAADGYGRGEGAGVVVLKKLADAERDGDRVYAVVKGTGSNQDGRTTAITVPNADLQEALAKSVTARAGIAAHEVTYVEAHGTGTPVGDPLELRAIGRAYGAVDGRTEPLGVGSVKAQIGHTEAASGIASVIKSALAISHRTIAPQGWLDTPNPDIPFAEFNLVLQLEARPVPPEERMTIAVNGFGFGGTNAHAILTEHRSATGAPHTAAHFGVLPLSGRTETAVRELAQRFAERIADGADPALLAEAAWTRRQHSTVRAGITFGDEVELVRGLVDFANGDGRTGKVIPREVAEPVFVFTGMGPQHWAMGRELLSVDGAFAAEAKKIDTVFTEIAGWSIIEELLKPEEESRVTTTAVAQPANFLVQVALYALLTEYGIEPAAVVGHSVGEVAAAYVTGMLSLRDALTVAYHRARLQATTAGSGGMLAVGVSEQAARELLSGDELVDIAAINSPSGVTLAGEERRLDEIAEKLATEGIFARRLQVEVPYHSYLMEPILDELRSALADLKPVEPAVPLFSTVTGAEVTGPDWDAEYWCRNVRRPVRFADATAALIGAGSRIFVEVGPHPVLGANIREILIGAGETGATIATLNRKQDDSVSVRQLIAGLYTAGVLDIAALFASAHAGPTPHIPLPRYPWQRSRLRTVRPAFAQARHGTDGSYAMLGDPDLAEPQHVWRTQLSVAALPWLDDHVVGGARILPGAAYLDAALSAAAARTDQWGTARVAVEDVRFLAPLVIADGDVPVVELRVEESTRRFTIRSRPADSDLWTVNATGRLVDGVYDPPERVTMPPAGESLPVDAESVYTALEESGLRYGPAFRRFTSLRVSGSTVVGVLDGSIAAGSGHLVHPGVVDAALQSVAALRMGVGRNGSAMVPVAVDGVRVFAPLPAAVTVVTRMKDPDALIIDYDLLDAHGQVLMQIVGLRLGAIDPGRSALQRMTDFFYETTWELRDPVDTTALPPADDVHTLVVTLGSEPSARAAAIAALTPSNSSFAVGDPSRADLEAAFAQQLRGTDPHTDRLQVVIVAGDEYDDLTNLWTLRRLALTLHEYDDERHGETGERAMTGDGSIHATVITERAFAHPDGDQLPNSRHTPLAGARRVLLNEQSVLRWRLVDIDPRTELADLAAELAIPGAFTYDHADEVYLRDGLRWVPVVGRTLEGRLDALDQAAPLEDPEANFALEIPKTRVLSQLAWRRCARREPGPGEIEIRTISIALNFKDPMKVMGVLTERELGETYYGLEPGMEGLGEVVRVGPGVESFAVGDRVNICTRGMIRRYNTVDAAMAFGIPADSDIGICSNATAFFSAEHSLLELVRVRAGETVLVHGAAGGVGSAAVQIAKLHGATVIGTAGTAERRDYVLAQGADHALNSRSLNFAEEVLALTGGRGADVVISTTPGDLLRKNFDAVAEFGRIVEVGKTDSYSGGVLDLRHFEKNVSYHSIDMDRMLAKKTAESMKALESITHKVYAGEYTALPYERYGTAEVGKAFEEVARSTKIGRVVLDFTEAAPLVRPALGEVTVVPEARYLITGGFGGFGLAVGRWLVGKGARRLTLVGRGGAKTEAARAQLRAWQDMGIDVVAERVDIADQEAVTAMIARAHTADHPLRGVFHAAGVLDDKLVSVFDYDSLVKVVTPKVAGARALVGGLAAAGATPDMLVLFSSGSAIFGGPGQYTYTAANLTLNVLADEIVRSGGTALAIGWGHMHGAGMIGTDTMTRYLLNTGFDTIEMDEGPEYLEAALRLGLHHHVDIVPIDWNKVVSANGLFAATGRVEAVIAASAQDDSASAQLAAALRELEVGKRNEVVAHMLAEQLATVMGVAAESIDLTVPVPEIGLDSLMTVEFSALVTKNLGVDLTSVQLGRTFTLQQAGAKVAAALVGEDGVESVAEVVA